VNIFYRLKNKFYIPTFKNPTQLTYDISRILFSLFFALTISITLHFAYFVHSPFLQVPYVGEVVSGLVVFSIFYYLIPFLLKAIRDSLTNLIRQSLKDFREFSKNKKPKLKVKRSTPVLVDTSALIDGRICDIVYAGFLDSQLLIPQFVLDELHLVSDSKNKLKRDKGRRGLNTLEDLTKHRKHDVRIYPTPSSGNVDKALVRLAKKLKARILTADYNLNKVAKIQKIEVLNINELAKALKTKYLPGDTVTVKIVSKGQNKGQGLGYLSDGSMVVVRGGYKYLNKKVKVEIKKILQKDSGTILFSHIATSLSKPANTSK